MVVLLPFFQNSSLGIGCCDRRAREDQRRGLTTVGTTLTVNNVAPSLDALSLLTINEGDVGNFVAQVSDPGSDDLSIVWDWDHRSACDSDDTYLNQPAFTDPLPSPSSLEFNNPLGSFWMDIQ